MATKNRYSLRSKIPEAKIRPIARLFGADLDASQRAVLPRLYRNPANRCRAAIRERMASSCEAESPMSGEVEAEESHFGLAGSGAQGDAERREDHCFRSVQA